MKHAARILLFALSLLYAWELAHAGEGARPKSRKVIDFEGDVVEGINRQPLGSFNQISELDGRRRKARLYRKRKTFKSEDLALIRELRMR
ncbi:MAG: hypothetical protein HYW49_10480 [Deltaproteobacteria bacterium]|nr:hypothetical protein [Deltaproteobacteria bacterium]